MKYVNSTLALVKTKRQKKGPRKPASNQEHVSKFAGDAYSLGARALRGLQEVRRLVNIEYKEANANNTGVASTQAGVCTILLPLAQGLDVTNRVGDSIKTQSIDVKVWIKLNGTTNSLVRVIVFRDWNQSGVLPTGADLLNIPAATQACTAQYNYINTNNPKPRFVMLFDEVVNVFTGQLGALVEFSSELTQHAKFRGTSAAIADQAEGALFMMVLTNEAATQPVYDYDTRVRFTDD